MRNLIVAAWLLAATATAAGAQELDFLGTWEWANTTYADGTVDHPGTAGYNEQLHFAADRGFVRYRDGRVVQSGEWWSGEILVGDCFVFILGSDFGDSWVPWVRTDTVEFLTLQTGFECPGGPAGVIEKTEIYFRRGPVATATGTWGSVKSLYR